MIKTSLCISAQNRYIFSLWKRKKGEVRSQFWTLLQLEIYFFVCCLKKLLRFKKRVQTKHVSFKVSLQFTTSLATLQNLSHLYPDVQQSPVRLRPIVQGTLWTSCDVFLTSTTQVSSGRYLSNICTPTWCWQLMVQKIDLKKSHFLSQISVM